MKLRTEASFSSKVACACVFGGVFVCYLVSNLRQMSQGTGSENIVEVYRAFDPISRAKPQKPLAYEEFRCDSPSKNVNKLCTMIPPQDILSLPIQKYLPSYKNPCWKTEMEEQPIRCLPYFFLLGAPRCGTTDLYTRMSEHPQIAYVQTKEIQWFTKGRYAFPSIDGSATAPTVLNYTDVFVNATADIFSSRDQNLYHRKIAGDFSVSTFWDNLFAAKYASMSNTTAQRNAECIHHLNPRTKFIVLLRDPIDRAYSDYLYFNGESKKSKEIFHEFVEEGIKTHYECLEYQPIQYCIDYRPNNRGKSGRLFIGLYHQHFHDYFKFFPRSQFFIFKLEDYSRDIKKYLRQIYSFLGLGEISDDYYQAMLNVTIEENLQTEESLALGDMLPETRKLLQDFYQPYNEGLAELIGESFNYNRR